MPKISIGIASGSLPASTVQAYPFMPGLMSASLKIWTFPALGRTGAGAWPNVRDEKANATARAAPEARFADRCDPGCNRLRDPGPIQRVLRQAAGQAAADGPAPAAALSCPPSASACPLTHRSLAER